MAGKNRGRSYRMINEARNALMFSVSEFKVLNYQSVHVSCSDRLTWNLNSIETLNKVRELHACSFETACKSLPRLELHLSTLEDVEFQLDH